MCTFYNKTLQKQFMEKNKLNHICFLDPNGEYFICPFNAKNPYNSFSYILTDGEQNCNDLSSENIVNISNATWVLHVQVNFKHKFKYINKILYTNKRKSYLKLTLPIDNI